MRLYEITSNWQHKFYWFEEPFDPDVKRFILGNPNPHACDMCQEESVTWAKKLVMKGFDVGLHGGLFTDPTEFEIGHAWVTVNGKIFDPTASQFTDHMPDLEIQEGYYVEHYDVHGKDVLQVQAPFI